MDFFLQLNGLFKIACCKVLFLFLVLVPFGWGQNPEDDPEYDHGRVEVSDRATLKGSLAAVNPLVTSSSTSTMTSSSSEPAPAVMEVGI